MSYSENFFLLHWLQKPQIMKSSVEIFDGLRSIWRKCDVTTRKFSIQWLSVILAKLLHIKDTKRIFKWIYGVKDFLHNDHWQFSEQEKWLFFILFDVYPFFMYHKTWTEKEDKTFIIPMVSQSGYLIKHSTTKTSIKINQTKSGTGKMSKWIVRENEKEKNTIIRKKTFALELYVL